MYEHEPPTISVVMPFYNVEQYVDDCMSSLLSQDFDRYEVVCVDDGSTDRTGTLLDGYEATNPRVRVLHTENKGLSEARNAGVRAAHAELVSFVDGDDVVSPHYLRLLHDAHGGVRRRMVAGNARRLDKSEAASIEWQPTPRKREQSRRMRRYASTCDAKSVLRRGLVSPRAACTFEFPLSRE